MPALQLWGQSEDAVGHCETFARSYCLEPQVTDAVLRVEHVLGEVFLGCVERFQADEVLVLVAIELGGSIRKRMLLVVGSDTCHALIVVVRHICHVYFLFNSVLVSDKLASLWIHDSLRSSMAQAWNQT